MRPRKFFPDLIGAVQVGSCANGVGRISPDLTGFSPAGVCVLPRKTHDFQGFRPDFIWTLQPDFHRILSGSRLDFNQIMRNLARNCLTPSSHNPLHPVPMLAMGGLQVFYARPARGTENAFFKKGNA